MKRPDKIPCGLRDYVLSNARAPVCLLPEAAFEADGDGLALVDIIVNGGRIAGIELAGCGLGEAPTIDRRGGIVLPRLVDVHTHLDKGHILGRRPNPDGTHLGARTSVADDRERNWSAEDVRARMDFALRCAFAHGTAAVRTHIDSLGKQAAISWPVAAEMRDTWKGRIALQAVALFPIDLALTDEAQFRALIERVAKADGIVGGMTFLGHPPDERSQAALEKVFDAAMANGLDLDFHVDESDSMEARSLGEIADVALRKKFKGRILAGHCCSLALFENDDRNSIIQRVAESGVAVVSLPMCNMYLQDRQRGRTPRWRGVAPVLELATAGVQTMVASDNTRDPFYAYGDLDLVEVFREATRILQLDHGATDWVRAVTSTPADIMRLPLGGRLRVGDSADLIMFSARTWNELNCRPQSDREVLVAGQAIDTTPPDYRALDDILGAS
jgi:cytosine deaminase